MEHGTYHLDRPRKERVLLEYNTCQAWVYVKLGQPAPACPYCLGTDYLSLAVPSVSTGYIDGLLDAALFSGSLEQRAHPLKPDTAG
ncbi:MAG: hypothetical protein UMU75_09190 [Halomonas sp.]|nr:hypothetical protein [Halomonas sp.]